MAIGISPILGSAALCCNFILDLSDAEYSFSVPSSLWYKTHFSRQLNCWSLRCSWSIACRRCSNYIFILNLTPGFNGLSKDNYKMRREAFKFWDLVRLILETLRYSIEPTISSAWSPYDCPLLKDADNLHVSSSMFVFDNAFHYLQMHCLALQWLLSLRQMGIANPI